MKKYRYVLDVTGDNWGDFTEQDMARNNPVFYASRLSLLIEKNFPNVQVVFSDFEKNDFYEENGDWDCKTFNDIELYIHHHGFDLAMSGDEL